MEEPKISPEQLRARAQEMYERKVAPEKEKEPELTKNEQELRKEIESEAKTPTPQQVTDAVSQAASDLLSLDDQAQLSELIKLVFTKSLAFALKVAQRIQNPLVVDTFHDLLAKDELYYKLLKEKKL